MCKTIQFDWHKHVYYVVDDDDDDDYDYDYDYDYY
jgi:hypothetical protein